MPAPWKKESIFLSERYYNIREQAEKSSKENKTNIEDGDEVVSIYTLLRSLTHTFSFENAGRDNLNINATDE